LNNWGISEPVSDEDSGILDFDFVITPFILRQKGNRVGYGKGFYDGFLKHFRKGQKNRS
jgi:5-formyltetrahydrofolate cyclo-ligase